MVDDDKDDRNIFEEAFDELRSQSELTTFNNGLEVLNYLEQAQDMPHILFLDLNMPVLGGLDTLRAIRKDRRYDALSVAIYSTSSSETDIHDTLVSGANVYIIKPNNFQTLKATILKVLKTKWQYLSSDLNSETFVLVV